jgi:hypothetical protein
MYKVSVSDVNRYINAGVEEFGLSIPEFVNYRYQIVLEWIKVNMCIREQSVNNNIITIDYFITNYKDYVTYYFHGLWQHITFDAYIADKGKWEYVASQKISSLVTIDLKALEDESDHIRLDDGIYIKSGKGIMTCMDLWKSGVTAPESTVGKNKVLFEKKEEKQKRSCDIIVPLSKTYHDFNSDSDSDSDEEDLMNTKTKKIIYAGTVRIPKAKSQYAWLITHAEEREGKDVNIVDVHIGPFSSEEAATECAKNFRFLKTKGFGMCPRIVPLSSNNIKYYDIVVNDTKTKKSVRKQAAKTYDWVYILL